MEKCIYCEINNRIRSELLIVFFSKFVGKEGSKNSFDSTIKIDSQFISVNLLSERM